MTLIIRLSNSISSNNFWFSSIWGTLIKHMLDCVVLSHRLLKLYLTFKVAFLSYLLSIYLCIYLCIYVFIIYLVLLCLQVY